MLVGRCIECERIERLLASARAGEGGTLVLRGDAGVGKTALLEFTAQAAGEMCVLRAHGVAWEADIAFAAALELLRPVVTHLGELPRPQRDALAGALALAPAVERDRFVVGAATTALLARVASQRPLLVLVDDAHWIDSASLEALLFAARRLAGEPVALVFAVREGIPTVVDDSGLPLLALSGLDRDATAKLACELLGSSLTHEESDRIYHSTQGYPLALRELSRLGHAAEGLDAPVAVSETVERAYARDVERCADGVRAVLLVAAADDSHDLGTISAAAVGLGLDAAELETAEALGLIELSAGRMKFQHPLVRSAVYQGAPAAARRAAHRALADALNGDWEADRRAWHRATGTLGPDADVAAELEATARSARARSGYGAAARALERAAQLTPDRETRARRLLDAADALWHAGRGNRAEELLDAALERTADPRLRANLQHLRGRILHFRGDPLSARALLVDEGLRVASHDRLLAADMLASAFHSAMFSGDAAATIETATTLTRFAHEADAELDARASALTGAAHVICGRLDAAEPYLRRSIAAVGALPAASVDPYVLAYAANSHGWLGEYADARALAARALDSAREQGAAGAIGYAAELLTEYETTLGNLDHAVAAAAESQRIGRETNQPQVEAWSAVTLAYVAAVRGQVARAHEFLDHAQRLSVPLKYMGIDAVGWVLGTIHLATGDAEAAIAALEPSTDLAIAHVNFSPWLAAVDLTEAYVRAGRPTLAAHAIDTLTGRTHQPWALAALARARGLVAEDGFDEHLQTSIDSFASLSIPYEEARSRLCYGERLRRAGRRVEARRQLRDALSTFERLRTEPYAERTRAELRASGETLRARGEDTGIDELTPQELQVALTVVAGMTNKEAAARLFLSTKTIEAHLHRTYRKLGISSRHELAPLLADKQPFAQTH
jgi:ATP/maltotriose-dependent transcriptional regulator MalT